MNGAARCFQARVVKNAVFSLRAKHSTKRYEPFYESFFKYRNNLAVVDHHGSYTYEDILQSSYFLAQKIKKLLPDAKLRAERISFLCPNDATYVSVLMACWITGNAGVPLCVKHPEAMLEYYVEDSQSKLLITSEVFRPAMQNIADKYQVPLVVVGRDILQAPSSVNHHELHQSEFFSWNDFASRRGLLIYTSGTTGKPKGVVLNHGTLHAQTSAVIRAWNISSRDSLFHSLPLHHIHGIMFALLSTLKAGGTVVMQPKFDTTEAWQHFLNLNGKPKVNLFFAVPTMYAKLVQDFEKTGQNESFSRSRCLETMRLFTSGSASLPVPVFHGMEKITGHRLVERYGMTETGMSLSNTIQGPRKAGTVGVPVPDIEVKIRKRDGSADMVIGNYSGVEVLPGNDEEGGELLVKSPSVFQEYWNKEKATKETFTDDGWFITGDTACYVDGSFRILGRTSVDIIKSGGYKISSLDVESCLLSHPHISECSVFGLDDDVWGERVSALVLFKEGKSVEDGELKNWCKQYIPSYSVPTVIIRVDDIPRNVLGKVNKKELKKKYSSK